MIDLSGKWSGTVSMRDVDGYCSYVGNVSATLTQEGNSLSGQYSFSITDSKPTGKLEGLESCSYDMPFNSGDVRGNVDGTFVILTDPAQGMEFTGSATSDLLTLNFGDQYVIGTVKLQKYADFGKSQPSSSGSEQTVNEMVQTGLSYLNEKRFDKALEYFSKIVGQDPKNIMGWMGKGVSYVGLKNYDQAITHFKKSLELSPDNKDALQWLARAYYLKGDCQSASSYSTQALRVDPNNSKFLAEKKIIDACLAKQAAAKPKPEPKPEIATKPEAIKLDYASVKATLDKIKDPKARAQKLFEILKQLPPGPIPDDLQELLSDEKYRSMWLTDANKNLLVEKLVTTHLDGSIKPISPKDGSSKKPVYFINGIDNTPEDADQSAQLLADLLGRPVARIYNKSDGRFLNVPFADIWEAGKLKAGLLKDNPAVQTLVDSILKDLKNGESVQIHAHSEGAIMTSVALGIIREMDPDFFVKNANKISVFTYGGAASTYPEGPAYNHMTYTTDPVPTLTGGKRTSEDIPFETTQRNFLVQYIRDKLGFSLEHHKAKAYLNGIERFVINRHLSDTNPREGIGKELAQTQSPQLLARVLKELPFGQDEVVHYYVKYASDADMKGLSKSTLLDLRKYLDSSTIKNYDITTLTKVNRVLEATK